MKQQVISRLFSLEGRIVMITGATGHLGEPVAKAIALAGGVPVLCARTEGNLHKLSAEIADLGGESMCLAFDVGDPDACSQAIERVEKRFGKLHGLVNCANTGRAGTIEAASAADFDMACRQNITGPFSLIQASLHLLNNSAKEFSGGSSVVNISSMYGMVSPDPRIYGNSGKNNPPYYGAAKAGLLQLTRYLAVHLGPQNIRVNSISPGPFPPQSIRETNPEFHASLCSKTPLGRIGGANELVGPVLFLLSDASSYITGANVPVDGGWTAW